MPFWKTEEEPKKPEVLNCSFCGKSQQEVKKLIAGPTVYICDECVALCADIVSEDAPVETPPPTLEEIEAGLTGVVGHARARKQLARLLLEHQERAAEPGLRVLISGPAGCGKTALARAMAAASGAPAVCVSSSRLTGTGYIGEDVESALDELIEAAGGDLDKAARGVLILDAVQDLAARDPGPESIRDVAGAEVQRALMRVLEGGRCRVPQRTHNHPHAHVRDLDTRGLLVVLVATDTQTEPEAVRASLREHGLGQQFLARVELVLPLRRRSADELSTLATEQLLPELSRGRDLGVSEAWVRAQAQAAQASDQGAWSLRQALAALYLESLG
jgi:ATP-dependent Clp protease ATP-binding subunit ClpX